MEQTWLEGIYADVQAPKSELKLFLEENLDGHTKQETISNYLQYRQTQNYDCVIGITGSEGGGKSSLAIEMAEDINRKNGLPFDYEINIIYNPEYSAVIRAITSLPERSAIVIDEAIRTMYARNWNNKQQKEMNTIFATIRKRNLVVLICIPNIAELDSFFKNMRLLAWIHIFDRGRAVLFVKDPNPFNSDPFNIKLSRKIIDEGMGRDRYDVNQMIIKLRQFIPNFVTNFKFDKLSEKKEQLYVGLAKKYLTELPQEEASAKERLRTMEDDLVVSLYESSPQWTIPAIAKKFKLSENHVRTAIRKAREEKQKEAGANGGLEAAA